VRLAFATAAIPLPAAPAAVVVADLNGHGARDLAVASVDATQLMLLAGNGNGMFTRTTDGRIGFGGGDAVAADINGDGRTDVVVSNTRSGSISTALGNGRGGVTSVLNSRAGSGPQRLVLGDVDGDHKTDVVVTDANGLVVLTGKGDGSFPTLRAVPIGSRPSDLARLDADGNGTVDLLVTVPDQGLSRLYLGNGRGAFSGALTFVGNRPVALTVGDFTGDGRADLLVANAGDQTLTLFTATVSGFDRGCTVATGIVATRLLRTDFNGDGRADVIAVDAGSGDVRVLLGRDPAICAPAAFGAAMELTTGAPIAGVALADVNADRLPDLLLSVPSSRTLVVATNASAVEILPGDLTRDGRVRGDDLALLVAELVDGDGNDAQSTAAGTVATGAEADVNGDGVVSAADVTDLLRRLTL